MRISTIPQNAHVLLAWLLAGLCALLVAAAHLRIDNTVIDDAFITYRYAARLAAGERLTYNAGERVLGTTTPGYAMLLAGAALLTGVEALPLVSRLLNMGLLLAAGGLAVVSARRFVRVPLARVVIFALFVLSPKTLIASFSGMESALFLALLTGGVWALLAERWGTGAIALGLLPIVRPEGVFVCGLVGALTLFHLLRRASGRADNDWPAPGWRRLVAYAALLALPYALWLLAQWAYYGSLVPHSVVAKRAGLYSIGVVGSFLSLLGGLSETYFLALLLTNDYSRLPSVTVTGALLLLLALLALLALGGRRVARAHPLLALLPLFTGVMLVFYAVSETLIFPQYYAFFEPLAKICWWGGLALTLAAAMKRLAPERVGLEGLAWGIAAALALLPALALYPYRTVAEQTIDLHETEIAILRQPTYRALAQQLAPLLPAGTVVLTPEIGELGFYLPQAHILDSAGLVSPQAVAYYPLAAELQTRAGVIPPGLIADYRPDVIITLDFFLPETVRARAWFNEAYAAVVVWRYAWLPPGSEGLYVYSRRDFAAGMALAAAAVTMQEPRWTGR
ncbi:MAG: hypothetical protein HXY40_17675 [Chloroflexi bacterium]|nr:hypothetical protein [Chloroflexota bacterium]